jgi:hypothetical protein
MSILLLLPSIFRLSSPSPLKTKTKNANVKNHQIPVEWGYLFRFLCFMLSLNIDSCVENAVEMLLVMVVCVEYLLVEEDRNEKFVVKLPVYVCMSGNAVKGKETR